MVVPPLEAARAGEEALATPLAFPYRDVAAGATDWDAAVAAAPAVPPAYTRALVEYQAAYAAEHAARYVDLSRVLYHEGKPVAVWPLSAVLGTEGWSLGSQEAPVRPPLVAGWAADATRRRLTADCMDWLDAVARGLGLRAWRGTGFFPDGQLDGWHRRAMDRGATPTVAHALGVDLTRDLEALRLNVRASYRPLIAKGQQLWTLGVSDAATGTAVAAGVFDEFRALHRAVAGRVTRSDRTWELNRAALTAGDAFLVTVRDAGDRLVGGGHFQVSRTDALYAVGVYDRSLFPLPLGHAVQWAAIAHMKQRGLRFYWIGQRHYASEQPAPTEKELAIGRFKEGFATHVFPELRLSVPVTGALVGGYDAGPPVPPPSEDA